MTRDNESNETSKPIEWESLPLDPQPTFWEPVPTPKDPSPKSKKNAHPNLTNNSIRPKEHYQRIETGKEDETEESIEGWDKDKIRIDWHKTAKPTK